MSSAAPRTTTTSVTATTAPAVPEIAATPRHPHGGRARSREPRRLRDRARDDRFYVAEKGGRVRIVDHGETVEEPALEVEVSGGPEQGLLGLVFSPDGTKLYVDYTDPAATRAFAEYSMKVTSPIPRPAAHCSSSISPTPNHNGGEVTFGRERMLYITLGDGGTEGDPQNARRTSVSCSERSCASIRPRAATAVSIPADNPFVGRAGARPEVWMYGLRNPWRFSFDSRHRRRVDRGRRPERWEEVDFAAAGTGAGSNWG